MKYLLKYIGLLVIVGGCAPIDDSIYVVKNPKDVIGARMGAPTRVFYPPQGGVYPKGVEVWVYDTNYGLKEYWFDSSGSVISSFIRRRGE